jgi:hypothetical protein
MALILPGGGNSERGAKPTALVCPRCCSSVVTVTCNEVVGSPDGDPNRVSCDSCGHWGSAGDWRTLAIMRLSLEVAPKILFELRRVDFGTAVFKVDGPVLRTAMVSQLELLPYRVDADGVRPAHPQQAQAIVGRAEVDMLLANVKSALELAEIRAAEESLALVDALKRHLLGSVPR